MSEDRIYADYNATVPIRECAKEAMMSAYNICGNPSSIHKDGQKMRKILEDARKDLKSALGLYNNELIFTSGATEGAQLAIESAKEMGFENIFINASEHDAVFQYAQTKWQNINIIKVLPNGEIDIEWLENAANIEKPLIIIMAANNETGIISPISRLSGIARQNGGALMVDATQAFGKIPSHEFAGFADWLIVSSHKVGGALGVGALVLGLGIDGARNRPGGGQEKSLRSGTQNTPAISGFAAAANEVTKNIDFESKKIKAVRDEFEKQLKNSFNELVIIGEEAKRLPNTSCFYIKGWSAEYMVIALDLAGVSISSGSACSSGSVKVSRGLKAMGLNEADAKCVVRVSFGYKSTIEEAQKIVSIMLNHYELMKSKAA